MGKLFRLTCWFLNRLLSCFRLSALCTCQHLTLPAGLASLNCCTVSISLYVYANYMAVESWFNSHRRRVATPFSYLVWMFWFIYEFSPLVCFVDMQEENTCGLPISQNHFLYKPMVCFRSGKIIRTHWSEILNCGHLSSYRLLEK